MDILHRKIFKKDEVVYFTRASVENPYIYLKFKGTIQEVEFYKDKIFYRIRVHNILEKYEIIQKYLNRVRFRVKNLKDGKYIDKMFYVYMFDIDKIQEQFYEKYFQYLFDIHSLLVFDSLSQLNENIDIIDAHIRNKINEVMSFILNRNTPIT